jgi:monoamine oxidase
VHHENARRFVARQVSSIACASPEEISILHMLFFIKSCQGLDIVLGDTGGAQQDLLIGGTQSVAERLADELGPAIRQNAAVRRIEWDEKSVVVHADAVSIAARYVVVAVPPHLAGAIEYEPSLPAARAQVTQRWPQGMVIKVQLIYAEPFWRRAGLSGESYDYLSFLGETDDSSVPERYSKAGHLCGFIYADFARQLAFLDSEERKRRVLAEVARRFGPEALAPEAYLESSWSIQPWTGGCFTGFLTPGATVLFRSAVRDPVGPLHWAGTETATIWPSFIDGAIRSGERAAMEISKAGP